MTDANILKQNQQLQRNIDILSEHVIFSKTDLKGKITDASKAFCKISGYSKEELLGNPHSMVRHEDMKSEIFQDLWNTIKSKKPWQGEIKNKRKDGTYYWTLSSVSLEYDEKGNHIGYMSIRQDITAKKDFEKQHLQLVQSEKMASLGEMIGNIAHQWRQPLSSITSSASGMDLQLQLDLVDKEEFSSRLNTIIQKANFLSTTIDTFRDFINDDKTKQNIDIQKALEKAINIVEINLKNNYITIEKNINIEGENFLQMVEGEFAQVIINIINNARDALVKNEVKNPYIKVDLKKQNNHYIITVEDNAGGVPNDIIGKIFEPYFTTKHQSQGTGLGLHMSYKIVTETLHGKLHVKNINNGAKFYIELPLSN